MLFLHRLLGQVMVEAYKLLEDNPSEMMHLLHVLSSHQLVCHLSHSKMHAHRVLPIHTLPFSNCMSSIMLWVLVIKMKACSPNNKNSERGIGVQPENQKSKAAKPLEKSYLYQGWVTIN